MSKISTEQLAFRVLQRALKLMGPRGKGWMKGGAGNGKTTFCASTAIGVASRLAHPNRRGTVDRMAQNFLVKAIRTSGARGISGSWAIPTWNDGKRRTWGQVSRAFKGAMARAKAA